jgi:hypothetical protein
MFFFRKTEDRRSKTEEGGGEKTIERKQPVTTCNMKPASRNKF